MKTEDIDKIIANAVAESKGKNHEDKTESKWHRPKKKKIDIDKVRKVLNYIFMIGFVVTVLVYFIFPDNKALFFSIGFGSMAVKVVEFLLRFLF